MDSPAVPSTTAENRRGETGGLRVVQLGGLAGPGAAAGGVWAVARMQAEALRSIGVSVELIGGWLGPVPQPVPGEASGTRYFRVHRPFPGAQLRGLISLRLPLRVSASAAAADIVQVHLCRDFITTVSTMLLRRRSTPVVAQSHGMLMPSPSRPVRIFDALITRRLVRVPHLWLTLTEAEEDGLQQLGVDPDRMRRVVNAAAGSTSAWSDPERTVFLFAARLAARKQPLVFVKAALAALDAGLDARFVLAGPDQGEAAGVRAMISGSRHAGSFDVPGELSPEEMQTALANCTAYVLPALNEPYPMSVIEAAAMGTPMIVTTECGLSPDLGAGDAAVLTEPTSDAFCEAMLKLAADRHRRTELGANARQLHRRIWSAESLAINLRTHYAEAIGSAGQSGVLR